MLEKLKKLTKEDIKQIAWRLFIIISGNLLLAFGTAIFLVQCDIIAGGLSGIGIITSSLGWLSVDITVLILQWGFFLLGWLVLGKKFAFQTLIATIVYPIGITVFTRVISYQNIELLRFSVDALGAFSETSLLIASIFGGALCGIGVALNIMGGGSTGGLDILALLLNKVTKIKTSFWMFVIDASVIVIGVFIVNQNNAFLHLLIGILCAFICAVVVELVMAKQNNCYIAEIISEKWKDINRFVQEEMGRGTTIVDVKGGYQFQDYKMIKVAFSEEEQLTLLNEISEIDKDAFVICCQAHGINGEGFTSLPKKRGQRNKNKQGE